MNDKEELPPLYFEVATRVNELKANNSSGFDNIRVELIECANKNVINYFLKPCASISLKKNDQVT